MRRSRGTTGRTVLACAAFGALVAVALFAYRSLKGSGPGQIPGEAGPAARRESAAARSGRQHGPDDAARSGQQHGPDDAARSGQQLGPDDAARSGQQHGPDDAASPQEPAVESDEAAPPRPSEPTGPQKEADVAPVGLEKAPITEPPTEEPLPPEIEPLPGSSEAVAGSFGISPSAECGRDLPRIFPMLHEAGVSMVRTFPEWPGIQPAHGQWNWEGADGLVKLARDNGIKLFGLFCYLTPWASSGGTRTFPIKDIRYWRDYVEGVVARYRNDIQHWEVYNEFNSGAFARNGTPKDYAELAKHAYQVAKKVNPDCKIGIGCASVAISFLEQVIQQGASGCFDFVNVHPYELLSVAMGGRESTFLGMGANLRAMLKKHGQRDDIELWVSEVGWHVTDEPAKEREQAEAVVKVYALCFAQGVEKVFWFEARGPYKMDLIRGNWSRRPSFTALQLMTRLLGAKPKNLGWFNPTGKSYGFVFQGAAEPVLVMWAMKDDGDVVRFDSEVVVTDVTGEAKTVKARRDVRLTRSPVFVTRLPKSLVAKARSDSEKPFPWLQDHSKAETVSCHTGAENVESGVSLLKWGDGNTVADLVDGIHVRRSDKRRGQNYIYFDVDDSYAAVGDNRIEITVVARRTDANRGCHFNICYESVSGYRGTEGRFDVPAGGGWHRHTFRVNDANFGNGWGWNFRIDVAGSPSDVYVKEVIVKRVGPKK